MKKFGLAVALVLVAGASGAGEERALINGLRAEAGLALLSPSAALEKAARRHARDMARKGFFDHAGSDGSDVMKRARRAGYKACQVAENIAKGQRSLEEVLGDWMTSPGHRRNMLNGGVRDYGLVRGDGNIWVLVLGRDGC